MSAAQSPACCGELVRFGKVLPRRDEVAPVATVGVRFKRR
jgi:hypothetical protein